MKHAIPIKKLLLVLPALAVVLICAPAARAAETLKLWDFKSGAQGWSGNEYLKKMTLTPEGLKFTSLGINPLMEGPAAGLLAGRQLRVTIRMRTEGGDTKARFFYGREMGKTLAVQIAAAPDNDWHEYAFFLPPLSAEDRFWFAPFSDTGRVTVAWIRMEDASPVAPPKGAKAVGAKKAAGAKPVSVASGPVKLVHYGGSWDNFAVLVDGTEMAASNVAGLVGFVRKDGKPEWLPLAGAKFRMKKSGTALETSTVLVDSEGGKWTLKRRIAPGKTPGALDISESVASDRARAVVHIPWITLLPGLGTFGARKSQAVFAGLEYLADDPSSSEADLIPDHVRTVPDPVKITFPLMAIEHKGKYVGLIWEQTADTAAVFDSPDRSLGTGAHLMAVWAPCVGASRRENELYAFDTFALAAGKPLAARFTVVGGAGESIVPAVEKYVAIKGLPAAPEFEGGFQAAAALLAHGWLDSEISKDGLWMHALWGDAFPPNRSADAPALMQWLAGKTVDEKLAVRLRAGAARGLERLRDINPDTGQQYDTNFTSGVGHVRFPIPQLIFGRIVEYTAQADADGLRALEKEFDDGGVRRYATTPGRPDFAKTHFADHANGYAATTLLKALEAAWLSSDPALTKKALDILDKQTALYANSEPRGAQTWEIPLHTPDILASAYLVKCYVLGYALTGRRDYLDQARYWAWTGVPFVYLTPPAPGRVGVYSTIAVYGGTNWQSPIWIGLPVQWCGLVYASALYMLNDFDPSGPWMKIARGITATGLLMSYPQSIPDRVGLLPDSYNLKTQKRNGPDINPGTVQAHLSDYFGEGKLYDIARLPKSGLHVSAPCRIRSVKEDVRGALISLDGWPGGEYGVLISGFTKKPADVEFRTSEGRPSYAFDPARGLLVVSKLAGPVQIAVK